MGSKRCFTPQLEALDNRALMAVALNSGILQVTGAATTDVIQVTTPTPDQVRIQVGSAGVHTYNMSEIKGLVIRPRATDNLVVFSAVLQVPSEVRVWWGNSTVVSHSNTNVVVAGTGQATLMSELGNKTYNGTGSTSFLNQASFYQNARIFDVRIDSLAPNQTAVVYLDGVNVGQVKLNAMGRGELRYDSTLGTFPANFPKIQNGSVLTIQINGKTIATAHTYL